MRNCFAQIFYTRFRIDLRWIQYISRYILYRDFTERNTMEEKQ